MAKERNAFKLGLTVLIMLGLFFGVIVFIGQRQWTTNTDDLFVRYPTRAPLPKEIKPGAQVFCGLQAVGQVLDVEFRDVPTGKAAAETQAGSSASDPAAADLRLYVYLKVRVDRDVGLRRDCRITARGPLLGGSGTLQIDDRGVSQRVVPGEVIDGASAGTFDAALDLLAAELDPKNRAGLLAVVKAQLDAGDTRSLLFKLHKSLEDVNTMTASVARQFSPADRQALLGKLHETLDNVNLATAYLRDELAPGKDLSALAKVHVGLDAVNEGLKQALALLSANRPAIDRTVASVERTAQTVDRDIAGKIAAELNDEDSHALIVQIHAMFERLQQSLTDINVVSEKVRGVVVLNEQQLNRIISNVLETSDQLKGAAKDLRLNPWKLLNKPGLFDPHTPPIYDAAREFSEAAARLDDALVQLKALSESQRGGVALDDPALLSIRAKLDAAFERFGSAEAAFWKQVQGR